MKQMSDSQSSQPTAFMSQLMKLSNQSQVHFYMSYYMFYMFYNCTLFVFLYLYLNLVTYFALKNIRRLVPEPTPWVEVDFI